MISLLRIPRIAFSKISDVYESNILPLAESVVYWRIVEVDQVHFLDAII